MTIKEEFERYDRSPKIYLVGVDYYNPDLGSLECGIIPNGRIHG